MYELEFAKLLSFILAELFGAEQQNTSFQTKNSVTEDHQRTIIFTSPENYNFYTVLCKKK